MRRINRALGKDPCLSVALRWQPGFCTGSVVIPPRLKLLIAIELKVGRFEPEYLGKLELYLEALDRNVRKVQENPAICMLLCASKDVEVVEYALSRSLSPAIIAEYQTQLPDKKLLQAKLHEFFIQNLEEDAEVG